MYRVAARAAGLVDLGADDLGRQVGVRGVDAAVEDADGDAGAEAVVPRLGRVDVGDGPVGRVEAAREARVVGRDERAEDDIGLDALDVGARGDSGDLVRSEANCERPWSDETAVV